MTVIQKHGNGKPQPEALANFQFGYDDSENKYGSHEGKTLFIKDGEGNIVDITQNFLKEEFVNYCFPCNENGEIDEDNGTTVYDEIKDHPINGILENFHHHAEDILDDTDVKMGQRVSFGSYVVNPKTKQFNKPSVNAVSVFSIDPTYLQKLKNSLEQKAIVEANSYADMLAKAEEMASEEKKTLESGVQFIVKHDEFDGHNGESWIWVVTDYDGEVEIKDSLVGDDEIVIIDDDLVPSPAVKVVTNYNGKQYQLSPVAPFEYLYHDPKAVDNTGKNLMLEVGKTDEKANTIEVGLSEHTENTIVSAFEDAYSDKETLFGQNTDDISDGDLPETIQDIKTRATANGQTFVNILKLKQKVYTPDGSEESRTRDIIDFNDFVLDEGSWD